MMTEDTKQAGDVNYGKYDNYGKYSDYAKYTGTVEDAAANMQTGRLIPLPLPLSYRRAKPLYSQYEYEAQR